MATAITPSVRVGYDYSVGTAIPANMAHAVSVSLPKWQDNVDYEEGRLTDIMQIGYPCFFVHKSIQKVSSCLTRCSLTGSTTKTLRPAFHLNLSPPP